MRRPPSEIYHVGENLVGAYNLGSEIAAYTFDVAVQRFGSRLDHALDSIESRAKNPKAKEAQEREMRSKVLARWLPKVSAAEPEAKPPSAFATPVNRL